MKVSTGNLKILISNLISNAVLKYDVVMYRGKIIFFFLNLILRNTELSRNS